MKILTKIESYFVWCTIENQINPMQSNKLIKQFNFII
jgi:hypothetical protein